MYRTLSTNLEYNRTIIYFQAKNSWNMNLFMHVGMYWCNDDKKLERKCPSFYIFLHIKTHTEIKVIESSIFFFAIINAFPVNIKWKNSHDLCVVQ